MTGQWTQKRHNQPKKMRKAMKTQKSHHCSLQFIGRLYPPPPSSDNSESAAKVATLEPKESEPKEAAVQPIILNTNLPNLDISSGLDIAPMDAILELVNRNLINCPNHKETPLVLGPHRRVGFASNWKLTCALCKKETVSVDNSINYLKRTLDSCEDHVERRSVK